MIRNWVKLWVHEWLEGTTRFQMSGAQRAFWIDLLAMAGRSRCPGIICAGQDGERFVGYPLTVFSALDAASEIDALATFGLFERTGKIKVEVTTEIPTKLYKVTILNWGKYQSEYSRQKRYRKGYKGGYGQQSKTGKPQVTTKVTTENTSELHAKLQPTLHREGEGEGEVKEQSCANPSGSHGSDRPSITPSDLKESVHRVWDYYIEKLGKNPRVLTLTDHRIKKGMARLRECIAKGEGDPAKGEELMKIAVDALAASDWHRGDNDRKKAYDSWERHLFPSQEKLEWWLEQ